MTERLCFLFVDVFIAIPVVDVLRMKIKAILLEQADNYEFGLI